MQREIEIRVPPEMLSDESFHRDALAKEFGLSAAEMRYSLIKRSIDSRKKSAVYVLRYRVWSGEAETPAAAFELKLRDVTAAEPAVIVGFGPAGMFAALRLIELGIRPIVLERGKAVRERRRDIAALTKQGAVNSESNYCFGEGGAGTFSDGKLYTRSTKRGSVERILNILVSHGAERDILIDSHPHIGTNRLPALVESIRKTVEECGGEVRFGQRAEQLAGKSGRLIGVRANDELIEARSVLLAAGHSARDVFSMLAGAGLALEAKPFALGVRVEHPQLLVDQMQYHTDKRSKFLPAANYSFAVQCDGRGVFSFCMCPGGIICPAATAGDEVVVNGWSPSKRNSRFANSGIVVEVRDEDLKPYEADGVLAGVSLQRMLETRAAKIGGGAQRAPAQRLTDFLLGKESSSLPECSYLPGLCAAKLADLFPAAFHDRLVAGFQEYAKKNRNYLSEEAVVVAVESRTSSPVRVPRDKDSLQHPELSGLFPVGEGAGYAGGIMSAALDGENAADAVAKFYAE